MARKKKELPFLENVEISAIAAEGKSIAKTKLHEDDETPIVIFIPYGAPGDIANIKIDKKKHSYCEGHIDELVTPSPRRIKPVCAHFGVCGGCKWQHLPYSLQTDFKRSHVEDALTRIGKVDIPEIRPTLGSDSIWRYRNKMEYTFSDKKWRTWEEIRSGLPEEEPRGLGFHIPGAFDKVLHINECHLQDKKGDDIRNFIYDYAIEKGYSFYNIKSNQGLLRTLMIRMASTGQTMVCLVFGEDDKEAIRDIMNAIISKFPDITSLIYVVNTKLNDSIADQEIIPFHGKPYIEEEMEGLSFRVNAKSFYQTNSRQAYELYKVVRKFAGLDDASKNSEEKPLVYDLYTGAGTIANFLARRSKKVVGIEYVKEAIEDARLNSEINGIDNTKFYAGDMKDILTHEFIEKNGHPDVMIVDPPRAGMHEDVVKVILKAEPEIIVYVSCNPSTQARDLAMLDEKYKITDVQPVDMFPHTHHIENVVRLVLDPQRNKKEKTTEENGTT